MKMFKVLLIITLVFYCVPSNGQDKDFIVLVTNDTIYGDDNSVKIKKGKFQIKIDGSKRIYEYDRVTAYYNSSFKYGVYIERVEIYDELGTTSFNFVERVNKYKGRINIYYDVTSYGGGFGSGFGSGSIQPRISESHGYISKNEKTIRPLPIGNSYFANNKTVKTLIPYLKDNPELASEIEGEKLSKKQLGDLIDRYNKSFEDKE